MKENLIPKTISIIGGKGKMGTMFAKAFQEEGCEVLVSGRNSNPSNIDITKKADIVIVTVPIRDTVETIAEIGPYLKKGAMITDFTSVKVNPCKAMLENTDKSCEVIGSHPLFGPSAGFENQNVILCKEKVGNYYNWYKNFLEELGLKVIEMSADEHDRNMAIVQCLTHFSNISLGSALTNLNCNLKAIEEISTPVYLMRIFNVGRIVAQDEELYSDIQMENPYSKKVSKSYLQAVQDLNNVVQNNDKEGFKNIFLRTKSFFNNITEKSMQITDKMIKSMNSTNKNKE